MLWAIVVLGIYLAVACYHARIKALPDGLSREGSMHAVPEDDVAFLCDVTTVRDGRRRVEQTIFDHALAVIGAAETFLLVDCFLFNSCLGREQQAFRPLCTELTAALLARKRACPDICLVVVTDPVNEVYGGCPAPHLDVLRAAGIRVAITGLSRLRDPNPFYSAAWRLLAEPWGAAPPSGGWLPHPFQCGGTQRVGLRAWLALLNFKANHRKVIVADAPAADGRRQMLTLMMTANPHDGSSAHGNVALLVRGGGLWKDAMASEQAVLDLCATPPPITAKRRTGRFAPGGGDPTLLEQSERCGIATPWRDSFEPPAPSCVQVGVLTEGAILRRMLATIAAAPCGGWIDLAMFYLAERRVIAALLKAANRGVVIRVLLDPNRDAFGYRKRGIPNRPVAAELLARGQGRIAVRGYDTHGEQFHSKLVLAGWNESATLFLGSANLTRRNLGDFNLESDLIVQGASHVAPLLAARRYFERLWSNTDGAFSVDGAALADASRLARWKYRFQECTGLGTF